MIDVLMDILEELRIIRKHLETITKRKFIA